METQQEIKETKIWISDLFQGRPESSEGRMEKEMAVYDLLDELEIPYERLDHEVTPSIEACHGVDERLGIRICKNLFLCNRQKTDFYLLMMPGDKTFHTKDLSKQLGCARLSFADAEHMEEYLHITPGSVSVMGLMNDTEGHVRLLMEREIVETEYLGFHPCVNTASLKAKTKDIMDKFLPAVHHDVTVVEL
ncbi:MAG: prolyl-tRNA synthetase associated domain-containing protein [Muricoprocola sp.]